jgi:hypothetical protein
VVSILVSRKPNLKIRVRSLEIPTLPHHAHLAENTRIFVTNGKRALNPSTARCSTGWSGSKVSTARFGVTAPILWSKWATTLAAAEVFLGARRGSGARKEIILEALEARRSLQLTVAGRG